MDKTYVKIFAGLLAFGGVVGILWGAVWLSMNPQDIYVPLYYDPYSGEWAYNYVYNPAFTIGWIIILVGIGQLILARWVHGLSKE